MIQQGHIEQYLVDALENITRGYQGLHLSVLLLCGMVVAATYLFIAVASISTVLDYSVAEILQVITSGDPSRLIFFWNIVGVIALFLFAGGFALWAWIREWQRLPYFLNRWESRKTTTGLPVSRPPGLMIFPAIALILVSTAIPPERSTSAFWYVFALSWPVLIGVGLKMVVWTFERPRQSVTYENYWIAGGVIFLILPVALIPGSEPKALIFMTLLVGFLTGAPVIDRYEATTTGVAGYELVWFIFGFAGVLLASLPTILSDYHEPVFVVVAMLLVGGSVLGLTRWYES